MLDVSFERAVDMVNKLGEHLKSGDSGEKVTKAKHYIRMAATEKRRENVRRAKDEIYLLPVIVGYERKRAQNDVEK